MLHPNFPIIEGHYQMTEEWLLNLPVQFNRRIEDSDPIIWRPGFTIYVAIWGNDYNKSTTDLLSWIKEDISNDATDIKEESHNNIIRLSYRLNEDSEDNRAPAY